MDEDGVKTVKTADVRRTVWLLAGAIVLVGAFLLGGLRLLVGGDPTPAKEPPPERRAARQAGLPATRPAPGPPRKVVPRSAPERRAAGAPPAAVGAADDASGSASNVATADTSGEADEPSGIALFPPPGTDPPKSGIVVPEDFELPEGYVRHHQTTDDGRALPPILMFHPDYEFVDENGAPVVVPEDRVVPPEMAPPGLIVRMLEVPETAVPMIEPEAEGVQR